MADRFRVTHHLSTSELRQFCGSALAEEELAAAASHTAGCEQCHHGFIEELIRHTGAPSGNITFEPGFWFRNEHVDFEQLVELADNSLDQDVEDIIDIHLKNCETCREDVRSFLEFRRANERLKDVSYGPINNHSPHQVLLPVPWWQRFPTNRVYGVTAAVLVAAALLIGLIAFNKTSNSLQAGNNNELNIGSESPSSSPSTSPIISTPVTRLRDTNGEVTIDRDGRITGLEELSEITRQQIARVALSERIDPATVLRELSAGQSGLRGNGNTENELRLFYPVRRVIIEDLPVFRWDGLPNATHYRVYVLDANGNQVSQSEELSPAQTRWKARKRLRRGQIFSWVVTALVDGKEIVSPPASAPEMKFAVLSMNDLQELNRLKRQNSHLALGIFYVRAGLMSEAERELQELTKLNPQTELPRKLLESVRRIRKGQ